MNLTGYSGKGAEISVIVCHHTGKLIDGFINSIKKSEEVKFQIIVMTSDEDLAMRGIPDCLVFHHPGLPASKRNAGVRIAGSKYLAFFDDDVEVDSLCLYHLKAGIQGDIAMTYGKLWNMEHKNRFDEAGSFITNTGFLWSRAGQNDIDTGQFNKEEYVLAGKSASCMVLKSVFKEVRGFDEDFGILGEETDLSWRIWLSGKRVLYVPCATGFHAFNTKYKPVEKHYTNQRVFFNGCRNYITMLIKNLGREHLWIIPIHTLIWFFAAIAFIITGKISQGWNILKGLWYVLVNLKSILQKRNYIQERRLINESHLWPLIHKSTPRGYYSQRFCRYITLGLHG